MKKYFLMLAACCFVFYGISQEESTYKMYDFVYIKPSYDKMEELMEAMAKHNQEFHAESPYRAQVWNVQTGTYAGWWAWIMGPCTYTELDGRPNDEAHNKDWSHEVMPYVRKISERNHWKLDSEVSYVPEITYTGKEIWTICDLKPFEGYRFTQLLKNIQRVYKEKSYNKLFEVYRSQFRSKNMGEILIASSFENWASFDEDKNFEKDYEDVFGEGSWWKFVEEYRDIVLSVEDQVVIRIPELTFRTAKPE